MKILMATGVFPPDIGGPAEYAKNLSEEFLRRGHRVKILNYGIEKNLPTIIRHFVFFFRAFFGAISSDLIISFDYFSVGLPSVLASLILHKTIIIRVSGDFLWENYCEITNNLISLKDFYLHKPDLSFKHRLIYFFQKFTLENCSALAFTTFWQKDIFEKYYGINSQKSFLVENFYGEKIPDFGFKEKNFLWAGRNLKLKNLKILRGVFAELEKENSDIKLEISEKLPYSELLQKIQHSYAVILPSISDVSPNFVLDAIRANKPFILTKETGLSEKLKEIGLFVNPIDKNDIKNKVLFLAEEKNYNEYKDKISRFNPVRSWSDIAGDFLKIYEKCSSH